MLAYGSRNSYSSAHLRDSLLTHLSFTTSCIGMCLLVKIFDQTSVGIDIVQLSILRVYIL